MWDSDLNEFSIYENIFVQFNFLVISYWSISKFRYFLNFSTQNVKKCLALLESSLSEIFSLLYKFLRYFDHCCAFHNKKKYAYIYIRYNVKSWKARVIYVFDITWTISRQKIVEKSDEKCFVSTLLNRANSI